jgi:hypothetical protein
MNNVEHSPESTFSNLGDLDEVVRLTEEATQADAISQRGSSAGARMQGSMSLLAPTERSVSLRIR